MPGQYISALPLLLRRYVLEPFDDRWRQLARPIFEIGGDINEPGRYARVGSCLSHLEQRSRCLARMKTNLGHGTQNLTPQTQDAGTSDVVPQRKYKIGQK